MMHYCYHPEHPARCVSTAEYESLLGSGWYDTPTKFPGVGLAAVPVAITPDTVTEALPGNEVVPRIIKRRKRRAQVAPAKKTNGNADSNMNKGT